MPVRVPAVLVAVLLAASVLSAVPAQAARGPVEEYAAYQPQRGCSPRAKPGTVVLSRWLVRRYGGAAGGISRACGGSVSEHTGGRALDWTLDATSRRGRRAARAFLRDAFAADRAGNPDALARRMGVMYVIWDDTMYGAWTGFAAEPYIHAECRRVRRTTSGRTVVRRAKRCSATLRHRDHLHVSLSRAGGRGRTSWYLGRVPGRS